MSYNPKTHVTLLIFSTFLSAFSLACIISFTDPQSSSLATFVFLYLSMLLFALGIFTLIGLGLRQWLWPKLYILNLAKSFRQAIMLSLLLCISFFLISQHLLFWWVEASLILFFVTLEAFLNLKI